MSIQAKVVASKVHVFFLVDTRTTKLEYSEKKNDEVSRSIIRSAHKLFMSTRNV